MSNHTVPLRVYFGVFGALMILTVLTVVISFVDLGLFNTMVALAIAGLKGSLVVLYFMHVKYSSHVVKIYAATGFIWLIFLFLFTLSDVYTRAWIQVPTGWT